MYETTLYQKNVPIAELIEKYRDEAKYLAYCRECPNFAKLHSCPPLTFDAEALLREYKYGLLIATKISYSDELIKQTIDKNAQREILYSSRREVLGKLERAKLNAEGESKRVLSVAASACSICRECARPKGQACKHEKLMRYTFDAFGFDVTAMLSDYFAIELIWGDGELAKYQCSLSMMLNNEADFKFSFEF